jgi:DNA-binding transcriptional LysR family regulator
LTPEGETFYALACQYRYVIDQMMQLGQKEEKKVLRVASVNSLGVHLFPAVYELCMERYPQVELEIQDKTTWDAFVTLERGLTDLAFGPGTRTSPSISLQPVFSEKMMILFNEGLQLPPAVEKEMLDPEKEIYIEWSLPYGAWHTGFFGSGKKSQIRLELMNQLEFFLRKAQCWALVPYSAARIIGECEGIGCSEPDFDVPQRITNCLCRTAEEGSQEIQWFLDCLQEKIESYGNDKITCLR